METLIDSAAGNAGNWVTDGDTQSFNTDVVEASKDRLVLVDLWAPWCGPCKQLGPVLEKIVQSAGGAVSLVKIDIDKNPQIAQALRVQSIPAVFAFKNGQPVDGFMGAVPESEIKKFIEKNAGEAIGPSPVEEAMETGLEALEADNIEVALAAFAQILEIEPDNVDAKAHLSRIYIMMGETEAAQNLLETLSEEDKANPAVSKALASLKLAENTANTGDLAALLDKVSADPDNLDARLELARAQIGAQAYEEGGQQLLEIIRRDKEWNDAIARQELLNLFEVLGPMHDTTKDLRRGLSSLLFS
ncbi:thioredoxin [Sneathiella sp.]|jgi:putative thioredoxin|uniref:thioredoxin n=1 Tax=Sneathiella sp. TaxID=1964365 RepID=UPI0039E2793C